MRSRSRAASSKRSSRGEPPQLRPQGRQRGGEVVALEAAETRGAAARCARRRLLIGPSGVGVLRHDEAGAATAKVDVAVGPRAAGVGRRPQLAQEPQLLERRLELRAEDAPLDPLERAERRLDRRPLAVGLEVRAQPGAEVARAADVEHLAVAVVEEVDARTRRRAGGEQALRRQPARARRRQLDELGDGRRAALLGEPDQAQEDLRRRLRIRQRAVARPRRGAEEVRERREPGARACGPPAGAARARPCRRPAPPAGVPSGARPRRRGSRGRSARCARRGRRRPRTRGSGARRARPAARRAARARRSRSARRSRAAAAAGG